MKQGLFFIFALIGIGIISSCKQNIDNVRSLFDEKDTTTAQAYLAKINRLLRDDPKNEALIELRADVYLKANSPEGAIADLNTLITKDPDNQRLLVKIADAYFRIVQTKKTKEYLEKCLALNPNNPDAHMKLAELLYYVQQYQPAIQHLDAVLRQELRNPKAYFMKGMVFKELGDTAKAMSSFQTVVEQNPEYYAAYMQLGLLSFGKKDPIAIQYFTTALKLDSLSVEALYGRAMTYQQAGDTSGALPDYRRIIQLDSCNVMAWYNQGYVMANLVGDKKQALAYFQHADKCAPNSPDILKAIVECRN